MDHKAKFQTLAVMTDWGGTPNYMSQEAFGTFLTKGTDLWSLGVMFNEMFILDVPFKRMKETQIIYNL